MTREEYQVRMRIIKTTLNSVNVELDRIIASNDPIPSSENFCYFGLLRLEKVKLESEWMVLAAMIPA